jgi:predicted PurR-regulated permease PerM
VIRARLRRRHKEGEGRKAEDEVVEIDPGELTGLFATPRWLRDMGLTAWLLVGVTLLLVGAVWIISLTHTIVVPVIAAGVIAAVASPLVGWLQRHRVPRPVGAILLLLASVLLGALVVFVVVAGITSQAGDLSSHLDDAKNTIEGWLKDLGVDPSTAKDAKNEASSSSSNTVSTLLQGIAGGIKQLSSLVFFLAMTALSLLFLLADGPKIRAWGERHMGVPVPVAHTISTRTLQSLRGYFLGVTLVAAFNAAVVGLGALVLGVPLAGTIAIVTLLAAYVPYIGAWTAGAFSVLLALGGAGTDAAVGMIVVQLLANSVLQQLVQPLAMGAALGIHPLAVLIVTIAGGALFGAVGLILSAPLTSAATKIAGDLARARAAKEEAGEPGAPPDDTSAVAHPA